MAYYAANHFLLSEPGELYKIIIDTADEGIFVLGESQQIIFANRQATDLLSVNTDQIYDIQFSNLFSEDDCEQCAELKELIQRGKRGQSELRMKVGMNELKWVKVNASPIIHNGTFKGSLVMIRDITGEHLIQKQMEENQSNYSTLFEQIPVPIWEEDFSLIKNYIDELKESGIKDIEHYFRNNPDKLNDCVGLLIVNNINQAVVDLNEAESKEDVLNGFRKLINEKSFEYALKQVIAISNNESVCEFDAELRTFKNNVRYVHFKWNVVRGHENTYKRVILSTTDLTERIIAENLALQHSNREKAVLLKEIHHRVKNNMQIITSLLNLQSHSIDDPIIKDIFNMSLQRISTMASIHEMLYRSNDFSGVNYKEYLDNLIFSLIDSFKGKNSNISYTLNMREIVLNINTSIPLGLLINEIVTNSLKHGILGEEKGVINLSMKTTGEGVFELIISDNGVGIPQGLDPENSETLGMQLIYSLVDQLSGTIEINSNNKGTLIKILFKELEAHPDQPTS